MDDIAASGKRGPGCVRLVPSIIHTVIPLRLILQGEGARKNLIHSYAQSLPPFNPHQPLPSSSQTHTHTHILPHPSLLFFRSVFASHTLTPLTCFTVSTVLLTFQPTPRTNSRPFLVPTCFPISASHSFLPHNTTFFSGNFITPIIFLTHSSIKMTTPIPSCRSDHLYSIPFSPYSSFLSQVIFPISSLSITLNH